MIGKKSRCVIFLSLLIGLAKTLKADEVAIAAVQAEGDEALKELAEAVSVSSDTNYFFRYGNQGDHIFDPHGNLYKGNDYESGPTMYYDTQEPVAAKIPLKVPQYPRYEMYHPPTVYSPDNQPHIGHYPCCHYSPYQESLNVNYNLLAHSPHHNCRSLESAYLTDHVKEHQYHRCGYDDPYGGPTNPAHNSGEYRTGYGGYTDAVVLGKGNCVNAFFNIPPGTRLYAPNVTPNGECVVPYGHQRAPNMEYFEHAHQRRLEPAEYPPAPPKPQGYDYFLECSCQCEHPYHDNQKPYAHHHTGYM